MFLFPYLIMVIYKEVVAVWKLRTVLENIFGVYCLFQGIAVFMLNCFWYLLILKGVKRLMTSKKEEGFEELDAFEAHGETKDDKIN